MCGGLNTLIIQPWKSQIVASVTFYWRIRIYPSMGVVAKNLQPSLVYHSLTGGHRLITILPFAKYTQCPLKIPQSVTLLQHWIQIKIPEIFDI